MAARGLTKPHEPFITLDVARRQVGNLLSHGVRITGAVERGSVVEADPIEWRYRRQYYVVYHFAAAKAPELFQQERRGKDGRAGIEGETVLAEYRCAAPDGIQFLQHGNPVAACPQPDCGGKTAEPRSYHRGMTRGSEVCRR